MARSGHLVRADGSQLALTLAAGRAERRRGLLGRDGIDGAFLLEPCRSVHTIGMRFAINVAHCRRSGPDTLTVRRVVHMRPGRVGRPHLRTTAVLETDASTGVELRPGEVLRVQVDVPAPISGVSRSVASSASAWDSPEVPDER
jgi:uncharacterized protein